MSKRKEAMAYIKKVYTDWLGNAEANRIVEELDGLSDVEFKIFMQACRDGEDAITVVMGNLEKTKINIDQNLAIAEKYGLKLWDKLKITRKDDTVFITPDKYLGYYLPLRLQSQILPKKLSTADNNNVVDELTDQPAGKSARSGISYPEAQLLVTQELNDVLYEGFVARAGDRGAFNAFNDALYKTGTVTMADIKPHAKGAKSTKTTNKVLTAMHLANTLNK